MNARDPEPRPVRSGPVAERRGPGPVVLVLPLLALALGILWLRHAQGRSGGERPEPPAADERTEVPGWIGAARTPEGARVEVRLVPLHDDAVRQSFDRDVLAGRLGLTGGQPWQLVLRYVAPAEGEAQPIALHEVTLRDLDGPRLRPVVPIAPTADGPDSVDPLLSLLAPPPLLAAGEEVTVVLWGEPPGESARLVVGAVEVPLSFSSVPAAGLPRTLARLDREVRR